MSLRRLFSTNRRNPSFPNAVGSTSSMDPPPIVGETGNTKEDVHVDSLDSYDPKEDHPLRAYYKGYNSAKKHILEKKFFQGAASESEIQDYVANLLPTIHMADTSEDQKKEMTEKGVRMALKHVGFLPRDY
ncbi:unnamed protein product [Arabis nemorensis]|uniref:Uncharacterized protein n=1 Tax=Arabis nemorensis TaxID=586526 RepID=A0A565B4U2_9BRAS|nr:unnamed protein product [Arabis nemorensis]